jgi:hypothetical protein
MPLSSVVGAQSIVKPGVCTSTTKPASPYVGQVIYMSDVAQTAVWDGTQWTVLAPIAGNRNAFINGAMNVWQRGTNTSLAVGGGSYVGPDRWWFYNNAFTSSISRQVCGSTLPQFQYCARIQRTSGQTATTASVFMSPLETINSVRFAGKNATLSFYARASSGLSSATALSAYVNTGTGTDQSNFGGGAYTGLATPIGFTPTLTTSWQRFSATGAISSTTTEIGVQLNFVPVGTAGASDYFEITGVQLEEGAVATPFEFEDYTITLQKCQRYYYRTYCQSLLGAVRDTNLPYFTKQFPTSMRISGTFSSNYTTRAPALAPAAAGEVGFYGNGWYTGTGATSINDDGGDTEQRSFYFTGWTGTAGQNLSLISSNYTWFAWSAEL